MRQEEGGSATEHSTRSLAQEKGGNSNIIHDHTVVQHVTKLILSLCMFV